MLWDSAGKVHSTAILLVDSSLLWEEWARERRALGTETGFVYRWLTPLGLFIQNDSSLMTLDRIVLLCSMSFQVEGRRLFSVLYTGFSFRLVRLFRSFRSLNSFIQHPLAPMGILFFSCIYLFFRFRANRLFVSQAQNWIYLCEYPLRVYITLSVLRERRYRMEFDIHTHTRHMPLAHEKFDRKWRLEHIAPLSPSFSLSLSLSFLSSYTQRMPHVNTRCAQWRTSVLKTTLGMTYRTAELLH